MNKTMWEPGTFWDNINATLGAIGLEHPGVVWGIASVDWPTIQDRDNFLSAIKSKMGGQQSG